MFFFTFLYIASTAETFVIFNNSGAEIYIAQYTIILNIISLFPHVLSSAVVGK